MNKKEILKQAILVIEETIEELENKDIEDLDNYEVDLDGEEYCSNCECCGCEEIREYSFESCIKEEIETCFNYVIELLKQTNYSPLELKEPLEYSMESLEKLLDEITSELNFLDVKNIITKTK